MRKIRYHEQQPPAVGEAVEVAGEQAEVVATPADSDPGSAAEED